MKEIPSTTFIGFLESPIAKYLWPPDKNIFHHIYVLNETNLHDIYEIMQ